MLSLVALIALFVSRRPVIYEWLVLFVPKEPESKVPEIFSQFFSHGLLRIVKLLLAVIHDALLLISILRRFTVVTTAFSSRF